MEKNSFMKNAVCYTLMCSVNISLHPKDTQTGNLCYKVVTWIILYFNGHI